MFGSWDAAFYQQPATPVGVLHGTLHNEAGGKCALVGAPIGPTDSPPSCTCVSDCTVDVVGELESPALEPASEQAPSHTWKSSKLHERTQLCQF